MKIAKFLRAGLSVTMSALIAVPACAQMPALAKIGAAGGVKGIVRAFDPGEKKAVGRILTSGAPLYLNEKIETGPDGSLQVMLIDETVFTIGKNSSMVLDDFVYDPKSHSGKVSATVTNGVFRFVTGQIGHKTPSDMKVKFPVGTMGIRGTIVAGEVSANHTTAVLLGPGANTNVPGERVGAFNLSNNGVKVDVVKAGYGTHIDGEFGAPTPPAAIPMAQLNSILGQISHPEGGAKPASASKESSSPKSETASSNSGGDSSGETTASADNGGGAPGETTASADSSGSSSGDADSSASSDAGQGTASASGDLSDTQNTAQVTGDTTLVTQTAANDAGENQLANLLTQTDNWDNIAASIPSGTGIYSGVGAFNVNTCDGNACTVTGTANFDLNIDFGAQTVGGAASGVASKLFVTTPVDAVNLANEHNNQISETLTFDNGAGGGVSFASFANGTAMPAIAVSPAGGLGVIQHGASTGNSNSNTGGALTAQVSLLALQGSASHASVQAAYVDSSTGGGVGTIGTVSMLVPCSGACTPH